MHTCTFYVNQRFILAMIIGLITPVLAHAQHQSCAAKRDAIDRQISYARAYHNEPELNRLKIAKAQIVNHCQNHDLPTKHQHETDKLQQQLWHDQQKLRQAIIEGDTHKIAKAQRHLDQTRAKLQQAKVKQHQFNHNFDQKTPY